jgi:hypothetical protein
MLCYIWRKRCALFWTWTPLVLHSNDIKSVETDLCLHNDLLEACNKNWFRVQSRFRNTAHSLANTTGNSHNKTALYGVSYETLKAWRQSCRLACTNGQYRFVTVPETNSTY